MLLEDELNHPSLIRLNRRLKRLDRFPIISILHHLRSSELRPAWQKLPAGLSASTWRVVDGFVFNSRTTQAAGSAGWLPRPAVVAYPALIIHAQIDEDETSGAPADRPVNLLFVGT
jgi:hypothetical protein